MRQVEQLAESQFMGLHYPPLPTGAEEISAALAMTVGEEAEQAQYAFSDIESQSRHFLLLSRLLGRDEEGVPFWKVTDVVGFPSFSDRQRLMLSDCQAGERTDVAALVEDDDKGPQIRVLRAWVVDRQREQLLEIAAGQAECIDIFWDQSLLPASLSLKESSPGARERLSRGGLATLPPCPPETHVLGPTIAPRKDSRSLGGHS